MESYVADLMSQPLRSFVLTLEIQYIIKILFFLIIFSGMIRTPLYEYMQKRKIQQKEASERQIQFEKKYARKNIILIPLVSVPAIGLIHQYGIFSAQGDRDIARVSIDIIILILFSDTYFYRTHRAMHRKKIYGKVHAVHHASITPTAYSSLCFDIWEVIINFSFLIRYVLLMGLTVGSVHYLSLLLFTLFFNLRNTYIHSGFHIINKKQRQSRRGKQIARSERHDAHHEYNNGNFALYFTRRDRVCGTVSKK